MVARFDGPKRARRPPQILTSPLSRRQKLGLLLLSAVLWWAAGAFWLFPLGWVALAPFFLALDGLPARSRFKWGYLGGFLSFFLINWWIIPTIARGASVIGAPVFLGLPLGILAVTLIALIHGTGPGLLGLLWDTKSRFVAFLPVAAAIFWWFFEWARCQGPISHSWGALAFSQVGDKPLLMLASLVGQHGLSALCVFFAAWVALWWRHQKPGFLWAGIGFCAVLHGTGVFLWGVAGIIRANYAEFPPSRFALLQTKVSGPSGDGAMAQALQLTGQSRQRAFPAQVDGREAGPPDFVVWPETVAVFHQSAEKNYSGLDWAQIGLEKRPFWLLTGAQTLTAQNSRLNEAVLISPDGKTQSSGKNRLVPFGESAPFAQIFPFLHTFSPQPEVTPGGAPRVLDWKGRKIGTLICFESCFPNPARDLKAQGAQILFVLTNDEWFAGTEAPRQHMAMGILRAVENGVYLAQAANGGYTFLVDPRGRVLASTDFGKPTFLNVEVPLF